jgi:hypothetical protein
MVEKWQTTVCSRFIRYISSNIITLSPYFSFTNCIHTPVRSDFIIKNRILITHQKILSNNAQLNKYLDKLVQSSAQSFQPEDQTKNISIMSVRYSTFRIHCQFKKPNWSGKIIKNRINIKMNQYQKLYYAFKRLLILSA